MFSKLCVDCDSANKFAKYLRSLTDSYMICKFKRNERRVKIKGFEHQYQWALSSLYAEHRLIEGVGGSD